MNKHRRKVDNFKRDCSERLELEKEIADLKDRMAYNLAYKRYDLLVLFYFKFF